MEKPLSRSKAGLLSIALILALSCFACECGFAKLRTAVSDRDLSNIIKVGREYVVTVISTKGTPFSSSPGGTVSPLARVGIPARRGYPPAWKSVGSGVVIDSDGYIVTTATLARDLGDVSVLLPDGREVSATIVGTDELTNMSLLKVSLEGLPSPSFGNSSSLAEESPVVVVGGSYRGRSSACLGRIRPSRRVRIAGGGELLPLDTSLLPGTSGAAVINMNGELVGIASGRLTNAVGRGLVSGDDLQSGFAVPIEKVIEVAKQLRTSGKVSRGFLGVNIARQGVTVGLPDIDEDETGALILDVLPGSPAERMGLRQGDVIIGVSGERVKNPNEFASIVASTRPGGKIRIDFVRLGRTFSQLVEVGEKPSQLSVPAQRSPKR
ncbi:MAG: trypsin-like peptidase domain-containing protein [Candidatus Eisenbacteria bacterium]|nr:trypsin-like peptidase domain-containing protein [Candidatus Eisenbacteria bacterium]